MWLFQIIVLGHILFVQLGMHMLLLCCVGDGISLHPHIGTGTTGDFIETKAINSTGLPRQLTSPTRFDTTWYAASTLKTINSNFTQVSVFEI